jgi:hypothetical protein
MASLILTNDEPFDSVSGGTPNRILPCKVRKNNVFRYRKSEMASLDKGSDRQQRQGRRSAESRH